MTGAHVEGESGATARAALRPSRLLLAGRNRRDGLLWAAAFAARVAPYALLVVIAAGPALYWAASQLQVDVFRSPDETTAYIVARTFAEEGRLYLQDPVTAAAAETPTGPRGFIQHEGRSVPFYPIGHGFLLGLFYAAFGDLAPLFLAALPVTLFMSMALTLRAVAPNASALLGLASFGVVPLWFFGSRVHVDVASATALLAVAALCFVHAIQRGSLRWLTASSAALGLAALMRHQEAVLLLLLGATFLLVFARQTGYSRGASARALLACAGAQVVVFLVPLALLNWATYGSPLTVGYVLFYREMFPDRMPLPEAGAGTRIAGLVMSAVFPGPIDLEVLSRSLWYRGALLIPVPLGLAAFGLVRGWRPLRRLFGWEGLSLLALAVVYVLVSRASPGTFRALPDGVTFAGSVVRYWLPVYLLIGLAALYGLAQLPRGVAIALSVLVLAAGAYHVWLSDPQQSVLRVQPGLERSAAHHEAFFAEHTEPGAFVFAGGFTDKFVTRSRRTAGVMRGSQVPVTETMRSVAENAVAIERLGMPVYFLLSDEAEIAALEERLAERGWAAGPVAHAPWDPRWTLLELQPPAQRLVPVDGLARFTVPSERFTIEVEHDGSSSNLVTNPSFERGLDGWSGPGVGRRVRTVEAPALFGERALRMEMSGHTDRVRRTWHVDLTEHPIASARWSARGWVLLEESSGAEAVVRTWVKGAGGRTLTRHSASLGEAGTEFVPLVIEDQQLPAGASRIEIQVALAPLPDHPHADPRAVAYWGGVELVPAAALPVEYCDGDHHGCRWSGLPHRSTSSRQTPIEALIIQRPGGPPLSVRGPLVSGDRLVVAPERLELVGQAGGRLLGQTLGASPGEVLTLRVLSRAVPVLVVSEERERRGEDHATPDQTDER